MGRETRKKLLRDESTIWSFKTNAIDMTKFRGKIFRYFWFNDVVETYFGVSSTNPYKDLIDTTIAEKSQYMMWFVEKKKMRRPFTRDRDKYKDGPAFTLILIKKHIFMNLKLSIYLLLNITTKKDLTEILLCTI